MKVIRPKFSTNLLLLILNLNLFAIQYFMFMSWFPRTSYVQNNKRDNSGHVEDSDEVIVYNPKLEDAKLTTTKKVEINTGSSWNWNWDGRSASKPSAQRYIYFIRHGQYYGTGPYEKHLSPMGKQQAQKTGEKLKSLNVTVNRFISSTSIRAAETADLIHRSLSHLDVEYSDELREGWPAFPDPATPGVWDKDDPIFMLDAPRIKSAFEKYIHRADASHTKDSSEVIVAHGNVIAYIVLRSLQLPIERWLKIAVLQGSVTLLQYHPNGDVTLRFVGDVGHFAKKEWSG